MAYASHSPVRNASLPSLTRNSSLLQRKPVLPWIPQKSSPAGMQWMKSTAALNASESTKSPAKAKKQHASFFLQRIQEYAPVETKLGSLLTFLDEHAFKTELSGMPERLQSPDDDVQVVLPKLFLTMNEALSNKNQDEMQAIKTDNEHQHESEDPKIVLLHDMHPINRRRAAKKLCQMIESEVHKSSQYYQPTEDNQAYLPDEDGSARPEAIESEEESVDYPQMKLPQLKAKVSDCANLREKLDKIDELSRKFFTSKTLMSSKKRGVLFQDSSNPRPVDAEQSSSVESNMFKSSKSSEKLRRQDSMYSVDPSEFLPEGASSMMLRTMEGGGFMEKVKKILPDVNRLERMAEEVKHQEVLTYLKSILDTQTKSPAFAKQTKKTLLMNTYRISMPESKLDSGVAFYIFRRYPAFSTLQVLDVPDNPLGDALCAFLCYTLAQYAENLSYLNLSYTGAAQKTSKALQELLKAQHSKLNTLKLAGNRLEDDGACSVVIGILQAAESAVVALDLASTGMEFTGVLALAKLLRINRTLGSLDLSDSKMDANCFRELCRALIVNTNLSSLSLKKCGLADKDMRDLNQMLTNNKGLVQLALNENSLTPRGLELLQAGLNQNKKLLHLGLSGNLTIVLEHLEAVKQMLLQTKEVEIMKEDDFLKSAEAKRVVASMYPLK